MKPLYESILGADFDFNIPTDFPDSETFINIISSTEWEWFKIWRDQFVMSKEPTIFQSIYKYFSKFWGQGKLSRKTPVLVTYIPQNQSKAIRIEYIKKSPPERKLGDIYLINQRAKSVIIEKTENFHRTIEDINIHNKKIQWCWFPVDLMKYLDWLINTTK